MTEVNRENLCVILIDKGILEDHLPNHVLDALKHCKCKFMNSPETYNRDAIAEERERQERHVHTLQNIRMVSQDKPVGKFVFGSSPMQAPSGGGELGRASRQSHFKKQASFDGDPETSKLVISSLHAPLPAAGQYAAGRRRLSDELSRISECTDDESTPAPYDVLDGGQQVIIRADVENESVFLDDAHHFASASQIQSNAQPLIHDGSTGSLNNYMFTPGETDVFSSSQGNGGNVHMTINEMNMDTDSTMSNSESRSRLQLPLGSSDSVSSTSSNKLLARRNIPDGNLRLTMPTNIDEAATPL